MAFDLAILNATIVSPQGRRTGHLYVQDGRIAEISTARQPAAQEVDASGLLAIPGVVDGHVHFMDPSEPDREDFVSGTSAAAAGGVTTVVEHTHSSPVRTVAELQDKVAHVAGRALVDFGLAAHVWPDRIPQLVDLWGAGAMFFKMFTCTTHGVPGLTNAQIYRTFEAIGGFGGLALVHCEDETLTETAEHELRAASCSTGDVVPRWRSREAELLAVNTVSLAAQLAQARAIVAHASHAAVIQLAAGRRAEGAHLSIESCPQYFYLPESDVHEHGSLRKFTPPARIRSEADREAMWAALRDGGITHVSSDHAPSTLAHKSQGIWKSPFGLPGVETTLPLLLNAVAAGHVSLERVVEVTSEAPARLYGLYPRKGNLAPGADADIVLIDPTAGKRLQDAAVVSRAGWTPYAGLELHGLPVMTFSRGHLVARDGLPVGEPGWGRFLPGPGAVR
ncbi:MAG: dihydroorotase [Symbiobacteriia bacterium]